MSLRRPLVMPYLPRYRIAGARHDMAIDAEMPQCRPIRPFRLRPMRGSFCVACGATGSILFAVGAVAAEDMFARAGFACRFEVLSAGKVVRVVDGRSFVLEDGHEARVAAIEVPSGVSGPPAQAAAGAKAALESMLIGQSVELRGPSPAVDRYGRTVSFVELAGSGRPVAQSMVARGHARVGPQVGNAACAAELLSRERVARAARLGLWAEPYYDIIEARNGSRLLAARGHFGVAEGKVLSVRESGGTIYLNFGRRWSEALTVTISKRQERIFADAGIWPARLENRAVRVRGWIEERNGPRIEASQPEQIEVAGLN